jgi:hypothetical protein
VVGGWRTDDGAAESLVASSNDQIYTFLLLTSYLSNKNHFSLFFPSNSLIIIVWPPICHREKEGGKWAQSTRRKWKKKKKKWKAS